MNKIESKNRCLGVYHHQHDSVSIIIIFHKLFYLKRSKNSKFEFGPSYHLETLTQK